MAHREHQTDRSARPSQGGAQPCTLRSRRLSHDQGCAELIPVAKVKTHRLTPSNRHMSLPVCEAGAEFRTTPGKVTGTQILVALGCMPPTSPGVPLGQHRERVPCRPPLGGSPFGRERGVLEGAGCTVVMSLPSFQGLVPPSLWPSAAAAGKRRARPACSGGSWAPCPAPSRLVISLPSVSERQKDEQDRI